MKNIFKFMGLALVAGSLLFTACKKDENDTTDTTPAEPQTTANVTFKGQTWEVGATNTNTQYVEQYGIMYERLYKVQQQLPYVDIMHSVQPGTYTSEAIIETNEEEGYTYVDSYTGMQDMGLYAVEYGEQQQVQGSQSASGDWGLLNGSLKLTAFEISSLTASMELTATMYDFYSWAYALVDNVEDAETADLSVVLNNYKL